MAPNFPVYDQQNQLTSKQSTAFAPKDTESEQLALKAKTAEQVGTTALAMANAYDTFQKTKAQANFQVGMADIQARAAADPDPNNAENYFKEIEQLKQQNSKGFASGRVRAENQIAMDLNSRVGAIKINAMFQKKALAQAQVDTMVVMDSFVQEPSLESIEASNTYMDSQVEAGLFDPKEGHKLKVKNEQKIRFNSFLLDFRGNPVEAQKRFEKGAYGMDIETREKAQSKLKELKRQQRVAEGELFGEMSLGVLTGETPEDQIDAMVEANKANPNEGITKAHGKQLKKALYRDIEKRIGEDQYETYKDAIDYVFSETADKIKGHEAILKAFQDGLTPEETSFLGKVIKAREDKAFTLKAQMGKKWIETKLGAQKTDLVKQTEYLLAYAKKIAQGMNPEVATRKTVADVIQDEHGAAALDPTLAGAYSPTKGFRAIPKVKNENTA